MATVCDDQPDAVGLLAGTPTATQPSATRAAVSRADARSRTGRASSNPYFCMPTRSAWPGRGRVSGRFRATSFSALTSSAAASTDVDRVGAHHRLPLGPLGVTDPDRQRRPEREPVPQAAEELDVVLLEGHPRAPPEPQPSTRQRGRNVAGGHLDPGGQALDHRDERRAVGLTGGQPTQHAGILPRAAAARRAGQHLDREDQGHPGAGDHGRPEGDGGLPGHPAQRQQHHRRQAAEDERGRHRDHDGAPADPAQQHPEHDRELDVPEAEAAPARRQDHEQEVAGEQHDPGDHRPHQRPPSPSARRRHGQQREDGRHRRQHQHVGQPVDVEVDGGQGHAHHPEIEVRREDGPACRVTEAPRQRAPRQRRREHDAGPVPGQGGPRSSRCR